MSIHNTGVLTFLFLPVKTEMIWDDLMIQPLQKGAQESFDFLRITNLTIAAVELKISHSVPH